MIIVYKDGSWKIVGLDEAWEFANDPDWLVSIPINEIVSKHPDFGDKVLASMDGKTWIPGVYEKNIDLFAQYGVRLESGELRYFVCLTQRALDGACAHQYIPLTDKNYCAICIVCGDKTPRQYRNSLGFFWSKQNECRRIT